MNLNIPKAFPLQRKIRLNNSRRLALTFGRRFGKTTTLKHMIVYGKGTDNRAAMIDVWRKKTQKPTEILFVMPTENGWKAHFNWLSATLPKKYKEVSSKEARITYNKNANITFRTWNKYSQFENSVRGLEFDLVLIDEAQQIPELVKGIQEVIDATLFNRLGHLVIAGTAKGKQNELYQATQLPDFKTMRGTSYDNPFNPTNELDRLKLITPPDIFAQEYLAEFIDDFGKLFVSEFRPEYHITEHHPLNPAKMIYLSFDFNVGQSACTMFQQHPTKNNAFIAIKEFNAEDREKSFPQFCQEVKETLNNIPSQLITISGDAAGNAAHYILGKNVTAYSIIKQTFPNCIFSVPKSNPTHNDSRILINTAFFQSKIFISKYCQKLITDLNNVRTTQHGTIDKSDQSQTHHLDTLRYFIHANVNQLNLYNPNTSFINPVNLPKSLTNSTL